MSDRPQPGKLAQGKIALFETLISQQTENDNSLDRRKPLKYERGQPGEKIKALTNRWVENAMKTSRQANELEYDATESRERKELTPISRYRDKTPSRYEAKLRKPQDFKQKVIFKKLPKIDFQEDDKLTPDAWIKRSPHLIRLTGKHPLNAEPPLTMLFENGFKTSNELFFVRNHGAVPKINFSEHRVTVTGLVKNELVFSMEEIMNMEMITENVFFACTGNRRKELNLIKKTRGFNYGAAAVGTAEWTGVPLWKFLEMAGVNCSESAHVHLEGSDELPKGSYDTSIPLLWCMDKSKKYMLAVKMNGETLPYDHGYPVRAILPGLTGGRMVKWLKTIRIEEDESTNYYHMNDNRVLYDYIDEEYIKNNTGVVEKKIFCVYELNIQSVIVYPEHDEVIDTSKSEKYKLKGFAQTGGLRWINRVEVSLDKGLTWNQAEIIRFEKELTYDANFNMVFWEVELSTKDIYHAAEISVRAVDSAFNTQPENRFWNIMGMMNNSWYKLKLTRNDAFKVNCKHPTLPGAQGGGWMEKQSEIMKLLEANEIEGLPLVSWKDIEINKKTKNIIVINDIVFDVSNYNDHPGGSDTLKAYNGDDCSDEFTSIHSAAAYKDAKKYIIGRVSDSKDLSSNDNMAEIIHKEYINDTDILLKIHTKKNYSSTKCFHVMLKHPDFEFARAYTPIDYDGDVMSIVIKIYEPKIPRFPSGGKFTQILKTMNIGEKVKVMGPFGELEYVEKGSFKSKGDTFLAKSFHFFAAGTGIAPIYSWVKKMLKENDKSLSITVTHCCENENHALLKNEFEKLFIIADRPMEVNYVFRNMEGYITREKMLQIIGMQFRHQKVFFLCGRPTFCEQMTKLLIGTGFKNSSIFEF